MNLHFPLSKLISKPLPSTFGSPFQDFRLKMSSLQPTPGNSKSTSRSWKPRESVNRVRGNENEYQPPTSRKMVQRTLKSWTRMELEGKAKKSSAVIYTLGRADFLLWEPVLTTRGSFIPAAKTHGNVKRRGRKKHKRKKRYIWRSDMSRIDYYALPPFRVVVLKAPLVFYSSNRWNYALGSGIAITQRRE